MALRVLLADESITIKKVFQLALQDYAVDVTSVAMGLDVMQVARQFKPDIIFCDILLQKRNGYDVCADLKNDPELKNLPVILMWSAFMELDEDKMQAARADGNLQKPFEVQDLRALVNQFVAKTRGQRLGQFLSFPKMPEMIDTAGPVSDNTAASNWNMESFEPMATPETSHDGVEDFQEVPLPPPPKAETAVGEDQEEQAWSTKSLSRFHISGENAVEDELPVKITEEEPGADLELELDLQEDETSVPRSRPAGDVSPLAPSLVNAPLAPISEAQLEKVVREQVQGMIEAIAWKVVPDLATQIIERELKRLLDEKNP